jgi:hypothetical protein
MLVQQQKNVPNQSNHVLATGIDQRIFLDIATVKETKSGPPDTKPNWRLMVDKRTTLKFSNFLQRKDGMVEPTCDQFDEWKVNGMPVKYVQLNGAGENKKLKVRSDLSDLKLNLWYEITTARNTLQQNDLVELGFAALANPG